MVIQPTSSNLTAFGTDSQNPAIKLGRRSWCALAVVSCLLIGHQLILQPALSRLSTDAPVINVAGRQRMLSQKLAKTVLALQAAPTVDARVARLYELSVVVSEWTRAHRGLQKGDMTLSLPGSNGPEIRAAFAGLQPHFQAIVNAVGVLETYDARDPLGPAHLAAIDQVLQHEAQFLTQMHSLVGLFAIQARQHVWQLQMIGWGVVATILSVLGTIQWLVIRPAVQFVGSRFASSEEQYRRLVQSMSEALLVVDCRGEIKFANRRFGELVAKADEELVGQLATRYIADPDRQRFYQLLSAPQAPTESVELALRCPSVLVETTASLQTLFDDHGERLGLLIVLTDITARKQAESRTRELVEQLVHADRLRSMGEMAAGLAHEVNQPLAAIANYAESGLATIRNGDSRESLLVPLQRILSSALRGGEIIRRARNYSQRRSHEVQLESINDLVREVEALCRPEALKRDVTIELKLAIDLPTVPVDGIEIQQVLTNLIQNAFAAMEEIPAFRRRVTIATEQVDGDFVQIEICDAGCGLANIDIEQVFEPFVTTRRDGLGLGLAIVRGIIEAHGGQVGARQNGMGGATFSFTLPIHPLTEIAVPEAMEAVAHA